MHHELKIEKPYYDAIVDGRKNFEIRNNDRGFQAGDTVTLNPPRLIDKPLHFRIGYVTQYAQREGFCVFSLLPMEELKPCE